MEENIQPVVSSLLGRSTPQKVTERALFMEWLACTENERKELKLPKKQRGFAKLHNVATMTLSRWKKNTEFVAEVAARRNARAKLEVGNHLDAIVKKNCEVAEAGDVGAMRLAYDIHGLIVKGPAVEINQSLTMQQACVNAGDNMNMPAWKARELEKKKMQGGAL